MTSPELRVDIYSNEKPLSSSSRCLFRNEILNLLVTSKTTGLISNLKNITFSDIIYTISLIYFQSKDAIFAPAI